MRAGLMLMLILAANPAATQARDLFVNNIAGRDVFDGRSAVVLGAGQGPTQTITRALEMAGRGDRIILAPNAEPYHECISLVGHKHAGDGARPFVILGNGAVLDGSGEVPLWAWESAHVDVFRFKPRWKHYEQLFRDDRPLLRRSNLELASWGDLDPLEWAVDGGYVYFRVEPGQLLRDYRLTHAVHPVGITLYQTRDVIIDSLTVQGFHLDGINAHDMAYDVVLSRVTSRGNGRSGVAVCGASRVQLFDCTVGDNGTAQLWCEGPAAVNLQQSRVLENTAPGIINDGGQVTIDGARSGP